MSLKLVFMGTPGFAVTVLDALLSAGHDIRAVYSQPPRRAGRGYAEQMSPVHARATALGLPIHAPVSLKSAEEQERFAGWAADAAVVVAYGLLLPRPLLTAPRHGCFNVHASLLPRWRGAAPIQRAIMAGDSETGISIMRMDEGLDTGPVCLTAKTPISPETTFGRLHEQLAELGAASMAEALAELEKGDLGCHAQPPGGATYAAKIAKAEARIDFTRPAIEVRNHIHGLSPSPGAWFAAPDGGGNIRIKVISCMVADGKGEPGTVLDGRLLFACGIGAVRPLLVQREGKSPMSADELLRGLPVAVGTRLA